MSTPSSGALYPQVNEAQEIGNLAVRCFNANHPLTWRTGDMSGDNDFGFDFYVQVTEERQVKWIFKVQLKGTKSAELNAAGDLFSISLSASTVRYYANTTEPILLVLADIGLDPTHPKNCPLYYLWIHDGLRRFNEREGLPDDQKYVTFQIPKKNQLAEDTDLSSSINDKVRISKVGDFLHTVIERHRPDLDSASKISLAENIPQALNKRGAAFINAVVEDSYTLWPEPKVGTLRWDITEALRLLKSGNVTNSEEMLNKAKSCSEQPEAIETAEMLYIEGRIHSFRDEDYEASVCYAKARELVPEVEKYIASWAEMQLRTRYNPDETNIDFSDVIATLNGSNPLILNVKVKAIAAERKFNEAIVLANSMGDRDKWVALATVYVMTAKFEDAISACNEGLRFNSPNDHQKILLILLRARAKFYLATNYNSWRDKDVIYPISGSADTNIALLKEAWTDTEYLIEQFRQLNWPPNTNFISDLWASIASVLHKQKETLFLLKEAAKARPSEDIQQALELIAGQAADYTTALAANAHLPKSSLQILRRLHLLHLAKKDSEFIALLTEELPSLDRTLDLFGVVLVLGIFSAKRIVQFDIARQWEKTLASTPEIEDDYAVYRYFDTINSNTASKAKALEQLEQDYARLNQSQFIGIHLFHELDAAVKDQGERIITLASVLECERKFSLDSLVHLAQAFTTLGRWDDLLALAQRALDQYENHERFIGIEAIALDRLGRSAEAATSLKALIDAGVDEPFALQTYLNIVVRSGFTAEAISLLETVLGQDTDKKRKLQYLQLFFNLVYFSAPESSRCIDILFQMAPLVDQSKEEEEGSFLVKYFMASQVLTQEIGKEKIAEISVRFENFFKNFPNSNILKQGFLPEDGDAASIISAIEKMVGSHENQKQFYTKVWNQLRTGTVPFPFAWRPKNILQNVRDLPHLWQKCKRSNALERQYHLTMVARDFVPAGATMVDGKIPLIDLTSLLVLQDLNLLDHLFKFFPKIAIGQATFSELNELIHPMSGSVFAERCLNLQKELKKHFTSIEQPYVEIPQEDSFMARNWEVGEVKELALSGKYVLYSDDLLFRIYCQIPADFTPAICTMDFLSMLEERDLLTENEVAEKISKLSAWHVDLVIQNRHLLAIMPSEFFSKNNVKDSVEFLHCFDPFTSIYNAIWDIGHPYQPILAHMGVIVQAMAARAPYRSHHLAAVISMWAAKTALRTDVSQTREKALMVAIFQIAFTDPPLDKNGYTKLVSAYRDAVEFFYAEKMDEKIDVASLKDLAKFSASEDMRNLFKGEKTLGWRLGSGFTEGTADADTFKNAYDTSFIEEKLRQQ